MVQPNQDPRKGYAYRRTTGLEVVRDSRGLVDVTHGAICMPVLTLPGRAGAPDRGSMESYLIPQVRGRFNDGFKPAHDAMIAEMPTGTIRFYVKANGEINFETLQSSLAAVTANSTLPAPASARAEAEIKQSFTARIHVEAGAEAEMIYSIRDKAANIVGKQAGLENARFFLLGIEDQAFRNYQLGGWGWFPVPPEGHVHGLALSPIGALNCRNAFQTTNRM